MSVPVSFTTDGPVRAPGLGLLAVPFVVAAFAFTRRRLIPTVLLLLWSLLTFVLVRQLVRR